MVHNGNETLFSHSKHPRFPTYSLSSSQKEENSTNRFPSIQSEKSILISNSSPSVSIGGEGLGGELDIGQTPTLASIDHSDHRITLKTEPGLAILDQHGLLARDSETDD